VPPVYDPRDVAELARDEDTRILVDSAATTMVEELGIDDSDVVWDVLQNLDGPNCTFYKSVPSHYNATELLDVYHVRVNGIMVEVYLKLKISSIPKGTLNRVVTVLSFKKK
jgi:hypothetical protein